MQVRSHFFAGVGPYDVCCGKWTIFTFQMLLVSGLDDDDGLGFTSFSLLPKSYRGDGRMTMKGSCAMKSHSHELHSVSSRI